MQAYINGNRLIVKRGDSPKIYKESKLFHLIKNELNAQGGDYIKKLMWKDGHMVCDHQYYIRSRLVKNKHLKRMIFFNNHNIRAAYKDYNEGELILHIETFV